MPKIFKIKKGLDAIWESIWGFISPWILLFFTNSERNRDLGALPLENFENQEGLRCNLRSSGDIFLPAESNFFQFHRFFWEKQRSGGPPIENFENQEGLRCNLRASGDIFLPAKAYCFNRWNNQGLKNLGDKISQPFLKSAKKPQAPTPTPLYYLNEWSCDLRVTVGPMTWTWLGTDARFAAYWFPSHLGAYVQRVNCLSACV